MLIETQKRHYTPEEYLLLEEASEEKNEYLNGEIIPMAGTTTNHNKIVLNFCRKFPLTINTQDYDIYTEQVRLWVNEYNLYTYPDVMIIKGEPVYHGKGTSTLTNPQIIIEVLSDSTQGYDRGDKFKYYRSLSSFIEYILIGQSTYYVEQYIKESQDKWSLNFYSQKEAILKLASVDWQISLQDLYQRVNFQPEQE